MGHSGPVSSHFRHRHARFPPRPRRSHHHRCPPRPGRGRRHRATSPPPCCPRARSSARASSPARTPCSAAPSGSTARSRRSIPRRRSSGTTRTATTSWPAPPCARWRATPARCSPPSAPRINFLQLLSAVATRTRAFVKLVEGTRAKILDTRKTLPGPAHRAEVRRARRRRHEPPHRPLRRHPPQGKPHRGRRRREGGRARGAARGHAGHDGAGGGGDDRPASRGARRRARSSILLDNFTLPRMREAVAIAGERAELEASGGVEFATVREIAETGVHRISVGSLTKDVEGGRPLAALPAPRPA